MNSFPSSFSIASGAVSKLAAPPLTDAGDASVSTAASSGAAATGVDGDGAMPPVPASTTTPAALAPYAFTYTPPYSRPAPKLMYPEVRGEERIRSSSVSCDSMRGQINRYLATKEMTQGQFRLECGNLASSSFSRFMKLKGPYSGRDNGTYWGTLNFFARRDKAKAAEKKAQAAEQREAEKAAKLAAKEARLTASPAVAAEPREDHSAASAAGPPDEPAEVPGPGPDAPPTKKARTDAVPSSSASTYSSTSAAPAASEYLPPEAITAPPLRDDAPVFDDCDEVRRKLAQCIQSPGMSQKTIAKYIGVAPSAISKFLSRHGKDGGAGTDVYPRAYRYFERLRVMRNEPKSSHRKRNESKLPPSGFYLINPRHLFWF